MAAKRNTRAEPEPPSKPRPLSATERRLIDFLVKGPLGKPALREQSDAAVVTCSCGCASVWLEVEPTDPRAVFDARDTPGGRTDHVALTAWQEKTRGTTEVTLHVVDGRLYELEIWAGYGVRPRVDIRKLRYA